MAVEVHQYLVTIPVNTPQSAPTSTPIGQANRVVDWIEAEVPPGPTGLMGFYLALSGQQVIPFEQGTWIVWDNRHNRWEMDALPTTGAWSLVGYNTSLKFPHAVTIRFGVDLIQAVGSSPALPTFVTDTSAGLSEVPLSGVALS